MKKNYALLLYLPILLVSGEFFDQAEKERSLKHYPEAIKLYTARLEKGGDKEEIWFSKYMLGECYEAIDEWDHALYWYLEAFQTNTTRADPLRKIATHYRHAGENDLAYMFARHGARIPTCKTPSPYTAAAVVEPYQFDEELSIAAYYTRFRAEGFAAANDLVLKRNVPWSVKEQAYHNMLFYVQPLKNARYQSISPELPLIETGFDERYHPMNPSIQKTDAGYKLILRAVNYTQKGAKTFRTIDLNGIIRTKNFLVDYDKEFNICGMKEIVEDLPRKKAYTCMVEGLEDCRIFTMQDNLWFTCTTADTNPTGQRQISLCKLKGHEVDSLLPLIGPDLNRCEKNWLPFVKNGELYVAYSYDPFLIYKPDLKTGDCEEHVFFIPPYDFSRFRGSAGPVNFDDGYLFLLHEVVVNANQERVYLHRFLSVDQKFRPRGATKPFIFKHQGVEYCCSMTLDHSGKELVLPIGIEDNEAYLCFVALDTVRSLLHAL